MDSWSCCGGNACYNEASLWILGVVVVAMHATMGQVYGFLELPCGGNALLPHGASLWILGVATCGGNALLPHGASLWILGVASCGGNALLPHEASLWILGVVVVAMHCYHMRQVYGFLELPCGGNALLPMGQVYGFLELPHVVVNALLPHEASLWILGVALWWQCIATT